MTNFSREMPLIWRLATSLLVVFLFVGAQGAIGQQSKRFDPKSYPAESFQVSHHDYPIGKFTVRIIQVKAVDDATSRSPSYCRAWLEVRVGGRVLRQAYFDDIDAVGSDYGILLPEHQPFENYFVALKVGDYDGRLLLVGKDGGLTELPGGGFFLTPNKRYLIGAHDSDYASLVVVDLARRRLVIDGEKEKLPGVDEWYMDNGGYFFTADTETGMPQDSNQETFVIYRLNLKSLTVTKSAIASARLKSIRKVETIRWQQSADCTSEP